MIDKRTIFEIHRLAHEGLSVRKIATILGLSRQTTSKRSSVAERYNHFTQAVLI